MKHIFQNADVDCNFIAGDNLDCVRFSSAGGIKMVRKSLFCVNIYRTGLGEKIEEMFREMIAGPDAVKTTVHKYVGACEGKH